jgi:hypothetical protein
MEEIGGQFSGQKGKRKLSTNVIGVLETYKFVRDEDFNWLSMLLKMA